MDLKPGNLVLVKADTFQGKRKIKDRWEDKPHEVVHQIMTDVPSYEVMDHCGESCMSYIATDLLVVTSEAGIPLYVGDCQVWDRCTSPMSVKPTPHGEWQQRLCHEKMMVWQSPSMPGQEDFPGVDQWEAMASPIDIHQSIHWGWVESSGYACSWHGCLQDCVYLAEG